MALSLSLWMHSHSLDQGQTLLRAAEQSERKRALHTPPTAESSALQMRVREKASSSHMCIARGGRVQNILALSLAGINYSFGRRGQFQSALRGHIFDGASSDAHVRYVRKKRKFIKIKSILALLIIWGLELSQLGILKNGCLIVSKIC
jgi:hypothetical protein